MKLLKIVSLFICLTSLSIGNLHAQFQGDVFFKDPSIAVPEGETEELEVQTFVGALPLGAIHFDLSFNPDLIEVVSVTPGYSDEFQKAFVSRFSEGKLSVITMNDDAMTTPFGTVSLARIIVKPRVPAGSRVDFSIEVRSLLNQGSEPFPATHGYSGELVVVSSVQPKNILKSGFEKNNEAPAGDIILNDNELSKKAATFRPSGEIVTIMKMAEKDEVYYVVPVPVAAAP